MSDKIFKTITTILDAIIGMIEGILKQWLGTVIGQRFLKWLTDILVTRFFDTIVEPLMRVGVVRVGYYFDLKDSKDRIKKLKAAEDSNNEQVYYDTLNDVFRK